MVNLVVGVIFICVGFYAYISRYRALEEYLAFWYKWFGMKSGTWAQKSIIVTTVAGSMIFMLVGVYVICLQICKYIAML